MRWSSRRWRWPAAWVFGSLAFELRPVLLGWLLLPLGAHVGCALEACLPEHPRP